jgi:predicted transcriptional regulator of viral defense system
MNQYDFMEAVRATGLEVLTPRDAARIAQVSLPSAYVLIHRLAAKGRIHPVTKGRFAVSDDIFCVASQVVSPAYLSFTTALYLHGVLPQVINQVFVVTAKKVPSPKRMLGSEVVFVAFQPRRVFGYQKVKKGRSFVVLADLEKAIVDCLYLPRYASIGEVARIMREETFDQGVLEDHARRMGAENVIRRAGYLLESAGFKTHLARGTAAPYKLNPGSPRQGTFNAKWRLYVNEGV